MHSICLLTTTAALAAQTFAARFEAAPLLVPGQRVRVWALEPAPVLGRGGVREARVVGTLTAYHRSFLYHTGRAAVVTVPVGLVFGILTTRWKRVY